MANIYVSPTGNASVPGSSDVSPTTLAHGSSLTTPGDTVYFLGGTYNIATSFQPAHSGTAGNYITYRNYDATPVNLVWTGGTSGGIFLMNPRNYIEIRGLNFNGQNKAQNGIWWRYSHHGRAIGNRVQNCGEGGIISRGSDYLTADGNLIHHNGYVNGFCSGISFNSTVWLDHVAGFHNYVVNNIISGQYDNSGHHTDGNGIIMDLSASGAYVPADADTPPCLIANNVIFSNGGKGITCYIVTNIWVVNNTVVYNGLDNAVGGGRAGQIAEVSATNCYFINNIAVSWDSRYAYEQGAASPLGGFLHYEKDMWNGGSNNFSNAALLHNDPVFVNLAALGTPVNGGYTSALLPWSLGTALELTSGSPARNVGIDPTTISGIPSAIITGLNTYVFKDIKGITRPQGSAFDLGAYEFVGGGGGGNTPPVAVADSYSVVENTTLTVASPGVLSNDSDANGDTLTAILNTSVSHGSLTLSANGSFVYTPTTSFTGSDSFTYHAFDGLANSTIVTVTITVTAPISTTPIAVADSYTIANNATLTIAAPGVLANDTNFTVHTFTAVLNTNVTHGVLALNANGGFTYTPTSGFVGTDSFTYHAFDTVHSSNIVTVSIVVSNPASVSPVANPDSYTVANNVTLTIAAPGVLANDINHTANTFTAVLFLTTTHGALTLNSNGSFTYTATSGFTGTDSFSYHAFDTVNVSNNTTVTITVTAPASGAPVAVADNYTTANNVTLSVAAPGVLANDSNFTVHTFTAVLNTNVTHGALTLNANGSFTYTPTSGFVGADSFTYHAFDTVNSSNIVTVSLTVTSPASGPPIGVPDSYTVSNTTTLTVAAPGVLANDTNFTANTFTAVLFLSTSHGTLVLNSDGSFTYDPIDTFSGTDGFIYRAFDTVNHSALVGVTITVTSGGSFANPVGVADSYTIANNNVLSVSAPGVLANDTNFTANPFTASLSTDVIHGVLALNSDGSFTYDPVDTFVGTDTFIYRAFDTTNFSALTLVTITVTDGGATPGSGDSPFQIDEWVASEPLGYDGFKSIDQVRALSWGFTITSGVDAGQAIAEVVFEAIAIITAPVSLTAIAEVEFEAIAIVSLPAGETFESNPKE